MCWALAACLSASPSQGATFLRCDVTRTVNQSGRSVTAEKIDIYKIAGSDIKWWSFENKKWIDLCATDENTCAVDRNSYRHDYTRSDGSAKMSLVIRSDTGDLIENVIDTGPSAMSWSKKGKCAPTTDPSN
ncbi:hypothetical protein [Labrys wisconsinensis]|uniref:Uncharacterized protein n=1 Tax=Labrys wisconsinensis TaxID=425677 RepID=A0ABU0JAN4_9HYPH|nr:hypothetical protein [Labrys wisconsinensis]MDQ0471324.1 hypothetical protein [Labrys wisconsinensis]